MSQHQPKVLERHQLSALLAVPNIKTHTGMRNRIAMELMARCGLRVSEVCDLRVDAIRWTQSVMDVRGKGSKDRCIPLHPATMELIQQWIDKRECQSAWIVCTCDGGQVSPRYLQAMIKRLCDKVGLPSWIKPHTLRHTYATQLLEEGFNIRMVQQLLGHSSVNTTMIYTHVMPVELAERIAQRELS